MKRPGLGRMSDKEMDEVSSSMPVEVCVGICLAQLAIVLAIIAIALTWCH